MQERIHNPWQISMRLEKAISSWQMFPDSEDLSKRVGELIEDGLEHGVVTIRLRKEILDDHSSPRFASAANVTDHGRIEDDALVFDSQDKLVLPRVGLIGDKAYLFLDGKIEKTFAFLKAGDILGIAVK